MDIAEERTHCLPENTKRLDSGVYWTYIISLSHSSQMFCPGGRPPVPTGASGRVMGAVTWRSPDTWLDAGDAVGHTSR